MYGLCIFNRLCTIRKMSSKSKNNELVTNGLNIVEKYSFRGRRKFINSNEEKEESVEKKKKRKTTKSEILSKLEIQTVNIDVKTSTKSKENSSKTQKTVLKVSPKKGRNEKNIKSEIDSLEVDIEDCDKLLNTNKDEVVSGEEKVKWVPENWEEVLKNIREMRIEATAPVDDMGCHKTMDENALPKDRRYQALISLMLSSQTKDQITFATMLKLREHGLTVDNILNTEEEALAELIKSVGFWKRKAKYIKATTKILKDEYCGDIPDTVEQMLQLPGVGPKMANLCMATAWNKVHGIGVDTHVHRISNRLKWVPKPTKDPERTRIALEKWLPHSLWYEVNHLMVGFGQQICRPLYPKCDTCLNNKICPAAFSELKKSKKKKAS